MESIQEIKEKITPILQRYGVTKAAIFRSLAKGEATTSSDVDILVEIKNDRSLPVRNNAPPLLRPEALWAAAPAGLDFRIIPAGFNTRWNF